MKLVVKGKNTYSVRYLSLQPDGRFKDWTAQVEEASTFESMDETIRALVKFGAWGGANSSRSFIDNPKTLSFDSVSIVELVEEVKCAPVIGERVLA